ncbi:MAG: PD-(D/E)XK nuclease family protein, partial [Myxococcota bacterium]
RDLAGLAPRHTFVVGLARGVFPRPSPTGFLGVAAPADPMTEARYLLAALLREASPTATVVLSWPATIDGAPTAPAPVLAELLDLTTAAPGVRLGDRLVATPTIDRPASRSDRLRAAALDPDGWLDQLDPPDRTEVARQRDAVDGRRGPLGPRDGYLGDRAPRPPTSVSVTALETYLGCPARYWYTHVLGVAPPDRTSPELEPRRRGIALHRILERLLRDRDLRPIAADPDPPALRRRLHAIAVEVLDAVEAEGGFDPLFHGYARARWLAGLIDDRPAGILRAWLDAETAGVPVIPEAVEERFAGLAVGPIEVRGVIDRVDRLPNGARLVTDYKTGAPPGRARIEAGLSFQPIAYGAWIARSTGAPVAAAFLSLARPDAVKRTAFAGEPTALDAACSASERGRAVRIDADRRDAMLATAAAEATRLVAGVFPPTRHPPELAGCPRCPFRRVCRVDPARHGDPSERDPCG